MEVKRIEKNDLPGQAAAFMKSLVTGQILKKLKMKRMLFSKLCIQKKHSISREKPFCL